jgi:hypothetical protein
MKTLIVAVGLFLLSALPVFAGPNAPDQHSTQFHALGALNGSQSATLQSLRPQILKGEVLRFDSDVMPVELTDAELKAVTGGAPCCASSSGLGFAVGFGGGGGFCNGGCKGNGYFTNSYNGRF